MNKPRIPVDSQRTADVINDGRRELGAMAPSMLKQKVVALIFLPWLAKFTGRVVTAAKEEERQEILAELSRQSNKNRHWKAALDQVREIIIARSA